LSAPRVHRVIAELSESPFGDDLAESCRALVARDVQIGHRAMREGPGKVPERLSERPTVTSRTGVLNPWADGRSTQMQATPTFAGIDWSWQHHALCIVDDEGQRIEEATVSHSRPGLAKITTLLRRHGVERVGIERGDGPVVEHLLRDGFEVVVISPRQVKSLRARYGSAGNKDDRFDAFVLADALRTDAGRWAVVQPDSDETIALRMLVRARHDLIDHRIAVHNQLLAVLQHNFPGAIGLFSQLDIGISLAFLRRFPSEAKAAWLSELRMAHWLKASAYCGRHTPTRLVAHLRDAATGRIVGAAAEASEVIVLTLVDLLATLRTEQEQLEARIKEALLAHPDGPIFQSCHAPASSAQPPCWPRSATAAPGSPTPHHSLPRPVSRPRPGSPANTSTSHTAAAATSNSAQPSSTGHRTPHAPTSGPETPMTGHEPAAAATRTQQGSWPKAGPGSSGAAGTTRCPTTRRE
jgi:transposase